MNIKFSNGYYFTRTPDGKLRDDQTIDPLYRPYHQDRAKWMDPNYDLVKRGIVRRNGNFQRITAHLPCPVGFREGSQNMCIKTRGKTSNFYEIPNESKYSRYKYTQHQQNGLGFGSRNVRTGYMHSPTKTSYYS